MTKQGLSDTTIKEHNLTMLCQPATFRRHAGSDFITFFLMSLPPKKKKNIFPFEPFTHEVTTTP